MIDATVWSPERLDFIGGAICDEGLVQRRGDPLVWNTTAAPLDLDQLPPLSATEIERLQEIESSITATALPEAVLKRAQWETAQRAAGRSVSARWSPDGALEFLNGDHEIRLTDGSWVSIDAILADPSRYHEATCADPLEPDYGGDNRIARVYTLNQHVGPVIHSNAHGGVSYLLRASAQADFGRDDARQETGAVLPSESERIAALHGFASRAFFHALPSIKDGELISHWRRLQEAASADEPLRDFFRGEVLREARALRTFADEADRFAVLLDTELSRDPQWRGRAAADRALLHRAAHSFIVDLSVLTAGLNDSPGEPVSLEPVTRDELVKGLIFAKSVAGIVAPPGTGKSWVALELACRTAKAPVLDPITQELVPETFARRSVKHGSALYFASEGVDGLRARVSKWAEVHGTPTSLHLFGRVPPLSDLDRAITFFLDGVERVQETTHVALIVVDVLRAAFAGEENSSDVMGSVAKTAEVLARMTGATVLLVHHSPKSDPATARGSTALPGALDFIGAVARSGDQLSLTVMKSKDTADGQILRWRLRPDGVLVEGTEVTEGRPSVVQEPDHLIVARAIRAVALSGTWVTRQELVDEMAAQNPAKFGDNAGSSGTVRSRRSRAIQAALLRGWIIEKGGEKNRRYTIGAHEPEGLMSVGNIEELLP